MGKSAYLMGGGHSKRTVAYYRVRGVNLLPFVYVRTN